MPIVKTLNQMVDKYQTKYSGSNVTTDLTAEGDLPAKRYEEAMTIIYNAVETVREILGNNNVPPGQWAVYVSLGEELARLTYHFSGATLQTAANAKATYFISTYGANPSIVDQIVSAITGSSSTY